MPENTLTSIQQQPLYVDAAKLAALFDPPLSRRFILKLQHQRVLPFIKLGRRTLFDIDAVKETITRELSILPAREKRSV